MRLYGELTKREVFLQIGGAEISALDYLDFSTFAAKMEEYDSLLKYSNIYEWMLLEGVDVGYYEYDISEKTMSNKDYSEVIETFYNLDDETKSKVLRHMFTENGLYVTRTVATKYDYVPTGNRAKDGTELTEYKATETMDIKTRIYSIFPLKLQAR